MTRSLIAAARFALFTAVTIASGTHARAEADRYDVYAVRFATITSFPASSLIAGADRARRLDIAMTIWVLKGADGRIVLVDSGFHRDRYFKQFSVKDFISPADALEPLGIKPADVTDILLSHMHWDHAGGLDLFPSARVWVQKEEYEYYTGQAWQPGNSHGGIDVDDVLELVKRNLQGLVTLVRGDDEVSISGIGFHIGGKHTMQSQYVTAQTRNGTTVVLASDNAYLYENLEARKPIAQTLDVESNLRAQATMRSLASAPRLIVPGHDMTVFDRFTHISERIVKIE
jgi:glyoxylase-like metal-dependent hydrolase (beta-lactamase superfamily II)